MRIEQSLEVPVPIDRVWSFFDDVPRVASCMPGATLTDVLDDRTFDGTVVVKVGPISVHYQGRLTIEDKDKTSYSVRLQANGRDRNGAGTARATVVARLKALSENRTELALESDVQLTGRIASLGRGVQDVAGKLFAQFGERMSEALAADSAGMQPAGTDKAETRVGGSTPPMDDVAVRPAATDGTLHDQAPAKGSPDQRSAPFETKTVAPAKPINLLRLLWSILLDKLARWLPRKRR